jgi:hypothetical protein
VQRSGAQKRRFSSEFSSVNFLFIKPVRSWASRRIGGSYPLGQQGLNRAKSDSMAEAPATTSAHLAVRLSVCTISGCLYSSTASSAKDCRRSLRPSCGAFPDNHAGSHGIAGCYAWHSRSLSDAKVVDATMAADSSKSVLSHPPQRTEPFTTLSSFVGCAPSFVPIDDRRRCRER